MDFKASGQLACNGKQTERKQSLLISRLVIERMFSGNISAPSNVTRICWVSSTEIVSFVDLNLQVVQQ
jgi:hypothetical protein